MDRINGADTVDIGSGRRGFRDENLVSGVAGTEVTADFLNSLQEEIMNVIATAGIEPKASDWTQLWKAIAWTVRSSSGRHAADTGIVNAYVATYSPEVESLTGGLRLTFRASNTNTGASTFAANGLSASIVTASGTALTGGEIVKNSIVDLVYNGTLGAWQLLSATGDVNATGGSLAKRMSDGSLRGTAFATDDLKGVFYGSGDVKGSVWGGGMLSDYLAATYAKLATVSEAVVASTIVKRAGDGFVYGTGFFNPSTKAQFASTGDSYGSVWGNAWLSAHLPATYVPLSKVASSAVVDTIVKRTSDGSLRGTAFATDDLTGVFYGSGDVKGSVWGGGVLSDYLSNNFAKLSKMSASIAANGYQKMPSGLIFQWGVVSATPAGSNNAYGTFSFPIAFPSACVGLFGNAGARRDNTAVSAEAGNDVITQMAILSTTQGAYRLDTNQAQAFTAGVPVYYFAIGY